jgi:glycosyltransferase involved in cell wall biosynthesis
MTLLKVLHVIPSVSPVRGGPSQAVMEMVRSLIKQGVDAKVATTNDGGSGLLSIATDEWIDYGGVPTRFFPRFSPKLNSVREFTFSQSLTVWLITNIRAYDLIHVHAIFSYPSTIAMAIARSQNVPYIVRPLGQLCEWSLQQSAFKKRLYLKIIERANLNNSRGIHITSEQEKEESRRLNLSCPSFVVPHGINFTPALDNARQRLRSQFDIPDNDKIILFLSRIHPKKGLDYLIAALGNLTKYPFTFILAGSGEAAYEAEVRSLLEEVGIATRTILPGFVQGETKDLLLQGADLYALTSHAENFGVAVLEALAAGLPTVVTSGVALSKEMKHYQLGYVSQLSKSAITAALEGYFANSEAAIEMGKRAQQFTLENFTWKKNAESLVTVYKSVLT